MRSPFLVKQDFLSPLLCEKIINEVHIDAPDTDLAGNPKSLERFSLKWEHEIASRFRELVPEIEERYDCTYSRLAAPVFQYFPENAKEPASKPGCENSVYVRKKWVKNKDVDLVGYLWLKDFNGSPPLDPRHEVFGGKLEFPVYNFSLLPQRGTLVIFPAGPHFISVISPVMLGDLYQIKLQVNITTKEGVLWLYQPSNFPGKWDEWFKEYA